MKEKQIVWSDFLSSTNFCLRIMLILCQAFVLICAKCSCHVQSLENMRPRCLCVFTSVIIWLFIVTGGWYGLLIFRENRRDSDVAGLKLLTIF